MQIVLLNIWFVFQGPTKLSLCQGKRVQRSPGVLWLHLKEFHQVLACSFKIWLEKCKYCFQIFGLCSRGPPNCLCVKENVCNRSSGVLWLHLKEFLQVLALSFKIWLEKCKCCFYNPAGQKKRAEVFLLDECFILLIFSFLWKIKI